MGARPLLSLAVAGTLVLGLAGCAGGPGSEAFSVNGESYSISDVERIADGIAESFGGTEAGMQEEAAVVETMVARELSRAAVAEGGGTITAADREKAVATVPGSEQLAANPDAREFRDARGEILFAGETVGADAISAEQEQAYIRINPRYGAWDMQRIGLATDVGSLSVPLQTAG